MSYFNRDTSLQNIIPGRAFPSFIIMFVFHIFIFGFGYYFKGDIIFQFDYWINYKGIIYNSVYGIPVILCFSFLLISNFLDNFLSKGNYVSIQGDDLFINCRKIIKKFRSGKFIVHLNKRRNIVTISDIEGSKVGEIPAVNSTMSGQEIFHILDGLQKNKF